MPDPKDSRPPLPPVRGPAPAAGSPPARPGLPGAAAPSSRPGVPGGAAPSARPGSPSAAPPSRTPPQAVPPSRGVPQGTPPGRGQPGAAPAPTSGRIVHDERGNAVWDWLKETSRIAIESTSRLLRRLDVKDLKVEGEKESELRIEGDGDSGGGYDPYNQSRNKRPPGR